MTRRFLNVEYTQNVPIYVQSVRFSLTNANQKHTYTHEKIKEKFY